MLKTLSVIKKAYIAGFLDGDGSIYARAKPNTSYRYGFQIALDIKNFLESVYPFVILKKKQTELMLKIIEQKDRVENKNDFESLLKLVDSYRDLNYSKKRKKRTLTP